MRILKGKLNEWPNYTVQMVERFFCQINVNVYIGQSSCARCQIDKELIEDIDLVIMYDRSDAVFIAWNTVVHRKLHAGIKVTLSIGKSVIRKNKTDQIEFVKRYLNGTNNQNGTVEYVAIIPKDQLFNFLEYFDTYCGNFRIDNDSDESMQTFQRKVDEVNRWRRDPKFREHVLQKYNSTCIVCGNRDTHILEAAHIMAVGEGGNDNVDNGICLCANHHKMYDAALINIDLEEGTFQYNGDISLHTTWYSEAQNQGFQLFLQKEIEINEKTD